MSLGINSVLEYRFYPAKGNEFDGEQLKSIHGEGMTSYLNRHLHTNINGMAGMNERFGRSKSLDKLAHRFMNTVGERLAMGWSVERRNAAKSDLERNGEASKEVPKHGEVLQDHENGGIRVET